MAVLSLQFNYNNKKSLYGSPIEEKNKFCLKHFSKDVELIPGGKKFQSYKASEVEEGGGGSQRFGQCPKFSSFFLMASLIEES